VIQPVHHAGSAYEVSLARAEAFGVLPLPEVSNEDVRFARPCRAAAEIVFPKVSETSKGFWMGAIGTPTCSWPISSPARKAF